MALERVEKALLVLVAVAVIGGLVLGIGLITPPWAAAEGDVRVVDGDTGEELATVDVEVADTPAERYTGLSDHESLADGEGMLFVHDDEDERTYVMREMAFGIDIIFVGSDGEITEIHHARAPEPGEDGEGMSYSGRAKWVLEVPYGYTNETGVEVGDELVIENTS